MPCLLLLFIVIYVYIWRTGILCQRCRHRFQNLSLFFTGDSKRGASSLAPLWGLRPSSGESLPGVEDSRQAPGEGRIASESLDHTRPRSCTGAGEGGLGSARAGGARAAKGRRSGMRGRGVDKGTVVLL